MRRFECARMCGQVYFVMSKDLCGQVYVVYMVYGLAVCCEFEWCSCVGMVSLDKNKLIFFMFSYLFLIQLSIVHFCLIRPTVSYVLYMLYM